MFLRAQYHSWHHFPSTLERSDELSARLQMAPNWGGRAGVKVLEDFGVHRNIQNRLPEAAQGQSCIWEGTISGQVSRQLNVHWIAALSLQVPYPAASPGIQCPVLECPQHKRDVDKVEWIHMARGWSTQWMWKNSKTWERRLRGCSPSMSWQQGELTQKTG